MQIKAKSTDGADLKAFLESEKARLEKEIAGQDLTIGEERAGYSNHMADDATLVFEQGFNAGMKRAEERLLAEVEDALKRMREGTYGTCLHCGAEIDSARLRAMPMASLCFSCQRRADDSAGV
jgi:RNA polymerase-binding protein DksA